MVAKADPRDGHESHDEFQTLLTRIFITLHVTDDKKVTKSYLKFTKGAKLMIILFVESLPRETSKFKIELLSKSIELVEGPSVRV